MRRPPLTPSPRDVSATSRARDAVVLICRRAALGAYVVGWLGPRWLVRSMAGKRFIAALLLGVVAWLVYQWCGMLRGSTSPGDPIAAILAQFDPSSRVCHHPSVAADHTDLCGDPGRRAVAPNPGGQILHEPSVDVGAVWQALSAAGSPLADNSVRRHGRTYAEYIWDAGRASGVDPAVIMGIFNVESKYGCNGVATLTHSPGNMRATGRQSNVQGYASFPDWFAGIDATYELLKSYAVHGAPTIAAAIPVWAPASDHNDPAAYIAAVKDTMAGLAGR